MSSRTISGVKNSIANVHSKKQASAQSYNEEYVEVTWLDPPELREEITGETSEVFITAYNQRLPSWRIKSEQDPNQEKWSNRLEFITGILGFTIGLDGVFLTPISAVIHGKVDFIFAFVILGVFLGIPLLFFETAIGQFSGMGPGKVFGLIPIAKGIGFTILLEGTYVTINKVYVARYAFYFFKSLRSTLPWVDPSSNASEMVQIRAFYRNIVDLHDPTVDGLGDLQWAAVGCFVFAWFITFIIIWRTIKTLGKIMLVLAPLTYVLYLALLITMLIQPGAGEGLKFFMTPGTHLLEFQVWDIALQSMMGVMSFGLGVNILFGSYTKFQSPAHIDCLMVSLITMFITILGCIFLYAGVGVVAHNMNEDLNDVLEYIKDDFHSEFNLYSMVLYQLPYPQVWYAIFFLLGFFFSIAGRFAVTSMISRAFYAFYPRLRSYPALTSLAIVVSLFLLSLPFFLQNGKAHFIKYITHIHYIRGTIVILELWTFVFCYGMKKLRADLDFMLQYDPNIFYRISWVLTPFILIVLITLNLIWEYEQTELKPWVLAFWIISWGVVLPIPVFALLVVRTYYRRGDVRGAFQKISDDDELQREQTSGKWSSYASRISNASQSTSQSISSHSNSSQIDGKGNYTFNKSTVNMFRPKTIKRQSMDTKEDMGRSPGGRSTVNMLPPNTVRKSSTPAREDTWRSPEDGSALNMHRPDTVRKPSTTDKKMSKENEESDSSVDSVMSVSTYSEDSEPRQANERARMRRRAQKNVYYEPYNEM